MRNINEEHIRKQQEKLREENDKRKKADSIEKREQKEKDEKQKKRMLVTKSHKTIARQTSKQGKE